MQVLDDAGRALDMAFGMFWQTLWALVLGFGLSGAVQAFVRRGEMRRLIGDHGPAALTRSSFFGMISSSCSYAAAALAKSLFTKGADFTAAMVFMIASTNLVVELGIVLWLLIGWQFAVAEFVGGAIMIGLVGFGLPRLVPESLLHGDANRPSADDSGHQDAAASAPTSWSRRLRSRRGWQAAAGFTISDLTMLRRELVVGFLASGVLAAVVPSSLWQDVFVSGHGFWSSLENVVVGPFIAIVSFVCSVGNVPLAAALWQGGISFGGVVSFVFADLITIPLLVIYARYYGRAVTFRVLACFWLAMSLSGLVVEYLFALVRMPMPTRAHVIADTHLMWNHTTVLNIIALLAFAGLYTLHRRGRQDSSGMADSPYATDPTCGMQVEKSQAPAARTFDGIRYWFCSERCQERFAERGSARDAGHRGAPTHDHQGG